MKLIFCKKFQCCTCTEKCFAAMFAAVIFNLCLCMVTPIYCLTTLAKMRGRMTLLMFILFLPSVYTKCQESNNRVLSCYDEIYYNFYVSIEVLHLHDSFCSKSALLRFFPSVQEVHVYGRYHVQTCREIRDLVRTIGCPGKA